MLNTDDQLKYLVNKLYQEYITYSCLFSDINASSTLYVKRDYLKFSSKLNNVEINQKPLKIKNKEALKVLMSLIETGSLPKFTELIQKKELNIKTMFIPVKVNTAHRKYEGDGCLYIERVERNLSAIDANKIILDNLNNCLFIDLEWHANNR